MLLLALSSSCSLTVPPTIPKLANWHSDDNKKPTSRRWANDSVNGATVPWESAVGGCDIDSTTNKIEEGLPRFLGATIVVRTATRESTGQSPSTVDVLVRHLLLLVGDCETTTYADLEVLATNRPKVDNRPVAS